MLYKTKGVFETILVADDGPVVLDVVTRILQRAGYRVLKADTAAAALEQANATKDVLDNYLRT